MTSKVSALWVGYFASEMNAHKSLVTTARQGNTTADDYV